MMWVTHFFYHKFLIDLMVKNTLLVKSDDLLLVKSTNLFNIIIFVPLY